MAIPQELKVFKQWVVSSSIKKIPYGKGLSCAKVDDRSTWLSFEEAQSIINDKSNLFDCIGFVLTQDDPYCIIDLDKAIPEPSVVQQQILDECSSVYTEISVSGKGYHIIGKATCPGRRKENVEIYSYSRYMILTGDTINDAPIVNIQEIVNDIISSMNIQDSNFIQLSLEDEIPDVSDDVVIKNCSARYGAKFEALFRGDWRLHYRSQSEADLMLIAIFCQHTTSNGQVVRLFKQSDLGKREKANRVDYLNRTINKVRQNLLWNKAQIDASIEEIYVYISKELEKSKLVHREVPELPEGIIKQLTNYIMNISVRPVYEISLVTALGFFAGLCGRSFNISNSGLNLYLLLLAPTGSGKEAISFGIDKVVEQLRLKVPNIDYFIGPKGFSSGQALFKHIQKQVSMCCVFGEFGYMLQSLSDKNSSSNSNMLMLRRALLDIYQKSGQHSILKPTAYADFKNDIPSVIAPNFTLIGEGTPETFYAELSESMISDGLLPRFIVVEYKGNRPPRNKKGEDLLISDELMESLLFVSEIAIRNLSSGKAFEVNIDDDAEELLDQFDILCDSKINGSAEFIKQMWNRAHLKALKLASLLAISHDAKRPLILREHAEWAILFVENEIGNLLDKFNTGELGEENKYVFIIKDIFTKYMQLTPELKLKANVPYTLVHQHTIMPEPNLLQKLRANKYIKKDYLNTATLKVILDEMVEQEILVKIDYNESRSRFGYNGILYSIGRNFI